MRWAGVVNDIHYRPPFRHYPAKQDVESCGTTAPALAVTTQAAKVSPLQGVFDKRAAAALGPKFKLADFHALVLRDASVPLAVLEQKVDR